MSAARPTLIERLQAQVTRLEREAVHLRTLDRQMSQQLRVALDRADELRRATTAQADVVADLRRQLAARGTELASARGELEQLHGELALARALAAPAPASASAAVPVPDDEAPPTRWNRLEID